MLKFNVPMISNNTDTTHTIKQNSIIVINTENVAPKNVMSSMMNRPLGGLAGIFATLAGLNGAPRKSLGAING
jgi:hypothetical protein